MGPPCIWHLILPSFRPTGAPVSAPKATLRASAGFGRAISLNPSLVPAWYNLGGAHEDLEDFKKTIDDYDQTISIDALINRALFYPTVGNYASDIYLAA